MIVSCPKCRKQYRLDLTKIIYSRLPDNSGLGVQLACSNCHEQWWETKKDQSKSQDNSKISTSEESFKSLTDLSLLYNSSGKTPPRLKSFQPSQSPSAMPKINVFAHGSSSFAEKHSSEISSENQEIDSTKVTKWHQIVKVGLISLFLFSSIVALAIFSLGYNIPGLETSSDSKITQPATPGEIAIEDVSFSTKPLNDDFQRVLVVGNVKNSTPLPIPLANLEITAMGTCLEGESPNSQGLCQIRTWNYKWKQDLLNPGEKLTFKSAAKIPLNVSVSQVYVNIPTGK